MEDLPERVARMEEWIRLHPERHALEKVALDMAQKLYESEYKILSDDVRELKEAQNVGTGEKGIIEKFLPYVLTAGIGFLVRHMMWK